MVIRSYNDRIARIKSRNDIEDEPNTALRLQAVRWEQELALKLIDDEEIYPSSATSTSARSPASRTC